jgi:D-arginine dehydrogenase
VYKRQGLRRAGGETRIGAPVTALARSGSWWRATVGGAPVEVAAVVNAAGAWADDVAALAGVAPVGLRPLRRTAFTATCDLDTTGWPLVNDVDERWYFKPEGPGQLLCSLADETLSDPCDAKPDEADVALGLDRINEATTLGLRHVRTAWAGLRTFAPDRDLVLGADRAEPSFFWSAGQGGYGIQTAPAVGALVAAAVLGGGLPAELAATGVRPERVSPARFAS